MLAFYVEWHMREAWAPLMCADTDQAAKAAAQLIDEERTAHQQRALALLQAIQP